MLKQSFGGQVRDLLSLGKAVQVNYILSGFLDSCTTEPVYHEDADVRVITSVDQWLAILYDDDICRITEVKAKV
jgi:hypothetical protein